MSFWRPGVFSLVFLPNLSVLVTITVLLINVDYVVFKLSLNCFCDFHGSTRLSRQANYALLSIVFADCAGCFRILASRIASRRRELFGRSWTASANLSGCV